MAFLTMGYSLRKALSFNGERGSLTSYYSIFQLTSIDMQLVPAAIEAYGKLNVKHEPLRLITPQFETPLPPLQPAVSFYSFYSLINEVFSQVKYYFYAHFDQL